jgi:hypothetical protein
MWPARDEAEANAIREAAFPNDSMNPLNGAPLILMGDIATHGDIRSVWMNAASELSAQGIPLGISPEQQAPYIDYYSVSVAGPQTRCDDPGFTWSFAAAGFCWEQPTDSLQRVVVDPARLTDPAVARRALLYLIGLREHSFHGVMNRTNPEADLSTFEQTLVRMRSLRYAYAIRWPDYDVR